MSDNIETQDTEPLTPDAARIVELERLLKRHDRTIAALRRAVENLLAKGGAGSSEFARSQPSDACEILHWQIRAENVEDELDRIWPVLLAALELGRQWEANAGPFTAPELTDEELRRLNTLAAAVKAFDALQPKG